MGKETRNFRQSKSSRSGNARAQNYGFMQRSEPWHQKVLSFLKVRGKAPLRQGYEGQGGKIKNG